MNTKKQIKGKQPIQASSSCSRTGTSRAMKMRPLKLTPEQISEIGECVKFIHAQPEELTPEQVKFRKAFDKRIKIYEARLIAEGKLPPKEKEYRRPYRFGPP